MEEKIEGRARLKLGPLQVHSLVALAAAGLIALQSILWRFSLFGIVWSLLIAGVGLSCLYLKRRRRGEDELKQVEIDEAGLAGATFEGKRLEFGWSELSLVSFSQGKSAGTGTIEVEGRGLRAILREKYFENHARLENLIRLHCERKHVKYEECKSGSREPAASKVKGARSIIWDVAAYNPREIFRYALLIAYLILLVILLAGWGEPGAWVAAAVVWVALGAARIYVPRLLPTKWLRIIHVTEAGLAGETFAGKKCEMPWEEVRNVVVSFPGTSKSGPDPSGKIVVRGTGRALVIGRQFQRFGAISVELARICGEKGIRLLTTGSFSTSPLDVQQDKEAAPDE